MPETQTKTNNESKIVLTNKNDLCISGVSEFISSTENSVILSVNDEELIIEGKNLSVLNLDTTSGVLQLKGEVNSICFQKNKIGQKFSFKKLFNR